MATPGGMRGRASSTADKVNRELAEEEARMIQQSGANLDALKPRISDKEAFERLVAATEESTRRNESVAEFQNRVKALGEGVVKVAKQIYQLIPK